MSPKNSSRAPSDPPSSIAGGDTDETEKDDTKMPHAKGSILIVDDDRSQRAYLRGLIEYSFPEVYVGEAGNFESAMKMAGEHDFDLFVMDVLLDGNTDGVQAAKALNALNGYHVTPVIFITAADGMRAKLKSEFDNFVCYDKPLKPHVFNRRVGRCLELMESLNQIRQNVISLNILETDMIAQNEMLGGIHAIRT